MTNDILDLDALLAEISSRLVMVGSVPAAQTAGRPTAPVEYLRGMVFSLEKTFFAFEMHFIGEIIREPEITFVPGLPGWVLGVTNVHGDILSVVDLPRFLGIGSATRSLKMDLLIAHAGDQWIALAVNSVEYIFSFLAEAIISPPFKIESSLVPYLRGAIEWEGEFIRLLDCERLILGPQMQQFR